MRKITRLSDEELMNLGKKIDSCRYNGYPKVTFDEGIQYSDEQILRLIDQARKLPVDYRGRLAAAVMCRPTYTPEVHDPDGVLTEWHKRLAGTLIG